MTKVIFILIILSCLNEVIYAQDDVSELVLESDGITFIKIMVNPKLYDNEFVSIHGYVSVKKQKSNNEWNLFLDKGACSDFDAWNSIILDITSEFISEFNNKLNIYKTDIENDCFKIAISGEFIDQSKSNTYETQIGTIKVYNLNYPFEVIIKYEALH